MQTIVQRLKKLENRQESDISKLDDCSGLIAITSHTYTVHDTIKQYIKTCISDASTAITEAIPTRDIDMLKAREYAFFEKQVAPSLQVSKEHFENLHNQVTSAIKEYDARNTVVASIYKTQNTSYEAKHTEFTKDIKFLFSQTFKLELLERTVKTLEKNQNTFDRKFTSAAPDLINVQIRRLAKDLVTHTDKCSNYTMVEPAMVSIRVDALETALANLSKK